MKILHVIHSIDPRAGGSAFVVSREIQEMTSAGHEVTLLSTDLQFGRAVMPRADYVRSIHAHPMLERAEVYLGHAYGRRRPWCHFAFSPDCSRWLRNRLSDSRKSPDVVHINATYSHMSTAAAAYSRRFSIPYLIRPLGTLDQCHFHSGHHLAKLLFARLFLRTDLKGASRVVACSPSESEEFSRWVPKEQLVVVPHGVEVPSSDSREAARLFLEAFPQCRGRRAILFLGRVDAVKRPEIIVAAMARLRPRFPDLTLIVAGPDAGHTEALRAAVAKHGLEDSMVYAGYIDGDLKRGAFAVSSVLALPSVRENFGLVVTEAMAHGVPALVTPGVASHVHVDASGGGITVEDNIESVVEGLRHLLAADGKAMGEKGRRYVEQHLSWESVARQIDSLYQEALVEKAR